MRQPLLREGASELTYEIRGIVKKAHLVEKLGQKISKKYGITRLDQRHHCFTS
jgi:hypothetical protein